MNRNNVKSNEDSLDGFAKSTNVCSEWVLILCEVNESLNEFLKYWCLNTVTKFPPDVRSPEYNLTKKWSEHTWFVSLYTGLLQLGYSTLGQKE